MPGRVRLTLFLRNTDGVKAKMRARTRAQKRRVQAATFDLGQEEFSIAQGLANRDTGYMAEHMRLEFTREGFNYRLGFLAEDFVGQTNPVSGARITFFYPLVVVHGGPHYAGNDFLAATRHLMRARIRERYRIALRG